MNGDKSWTLCLLLKTARWWPRAIKEVRLLLSMANFLIKCSTGSVYIW